MTTQLTFDFGSIKSATYHVTARIECLEECIACGNEFVVRARVEYGDVEHSKACRSCLEAAARDRNVSAFKTSAVRRGRKPLTAKAAKRMVLRGRKIH